MVLPFRPKLCTATLCIRNVGVKADSLLDQVYLLILVIGAYGCGNVEKSKGGQIKSDNVLSCPCLFDEFWKNVSHSILIALCDLDVWGDFTSSEIESPCKTRFITIRYRMRISQLINNCTYKRE